MSNTETHIGKLRRVELNGLELETWAEQKCKELKLKNKGYSSWAECLFDETYEKYFKINGEVWEAFDHRQFEEDDIDEFELQPDGTIVFMTQFYNGGTCLAEVVEEGIIRATKARV